MYFIREGIVDIITQGGEVATSLSDGSYFGGQFNEYNDNLKCNHYIIIVCYRVYDPSPRPHSAFQHIYDSQIHASLPTGAMSLAFVVILRDASLITS